MSTTTSTTETDTQTAISLIEQHLIDDIDGDHGYYRSQDIADDIDLETRQVAALIEKVDTMSTDISIEPWAYSNATTWLVEATD